MRPEKLTLLNIGPFAGRHVLDFSRLGSIFLVYGKTGAGKTTIFDALSYVFYGEAPGSRKNLTLQMRSHFAAEDDQSAVELEFTLAPSRWRIRRSLPQDRRGKRSERIQRVPEESTLEQWDGSSWVDRSSANKSETDQAIRELIGLSAEEFSRIVLLPQGEFAQFLRQKTSERKQVLAKLFPVEDHLRVMELARNRNREAQARLAAAEEAVLSMGEEFDPDTAEETRRSLESRLAELRALQDRDRQALKERTSELERARGHAERLDKRARAAAEAEELEGRKAEMEALASEIGAARKAEPLAEMGKSLEARRQGLLQNGRELSEAESERLETEKRLEELASRSDAVREDEKAKAQAMARKEKLEVALDISRELEGAEGELAKLREDRRSARKDLETLRKEAADLEALAAKLAPLTAEFEQRSREREDAALLLERAKRLKSLSEEYGRERLSLEAHRSSAETSREALAQAEKDLEIAAAEVQALEAENLRSRERDAAAELAARLVPGAPCPVCGSPEHPAPAAAAPLSDFTLPERLETARRAQSLLEKERNRRSEELATRSERRNSAEETLKRSVERFCREAFGEDSCLRESEIPSPEKAAEGLREAAGAMQRAAARLGEAQRALNEQRNLATRREASGERISALEKTLAALDLEIASRETSVKLRTARFMEAFPGDQIPAAVDSESVADELERCHSLIIELEGRIESHRRDTGNLEKYRSALISKAETLSAAAASLEREIGEAELSFAARCAEEGFADGGAALAALRDRETLSLMVEREEEWKRKRAETRGTLARLDSEIARWSGPDQEQAAAAAAALEGILEERDREMTGMLRELAALEGRVSRWEGLERERRLRAEEALRIDALHRDLSGGNPQKVPFDAWILAMYLEEITRYANERLERMSDGRYRIRVSDASRSGNALSGLDLEIQDAWTGKTRPAGTLSGGETFMASISLALGLADSIQARSGGIQLDAVFIDEGFGSLDEGSLERAITILDEIRGTRTVGLISHVAELRSRIPSRIEVVKTAAGSAIREE